MSHPRRSVHGMDTTSTAVLEDGPTSLAAGVDLLAELDQLATQRERLVLQVVAVLARVNRAGVVEAIEGLPVDTLLAVRHGWTRAERAMLLDAGDVLASMPATLAWWQQGVVSWSVVRDVVCRVRSLGREGRQLVDARLHASKDLLADMDPDRIAWAVEDAVEEVRGLSEKQEQERLAEQQSYLHFQLDVFGGSKVSGYFDALDTTVVTNALDHRAARTETTDEGHKGCERRQAMPQPAWKKRQTRAKRRAAALIDLARDELAGRDADGRVVPAKPLLVVHVPLDGITETASGLLECAVPHALPTISAALLEILSEDADVRAVLFDGARPLAVSQKVNATTLPDDTRLAVQARDLGARDPGGTTPVPLSHVHHLRPGRHHPDQLVCASPRGHLRTIHRHGWSGRVIDDGVVEWTRGYAVIRTRPWHTRLAQPDSDEPGPDEPDRRRRHPSRLGPCGRNPPPPLDN